MWRGRRLTLLDFLGPPSWNRFKFWYPAAIPNDQPDTLSTLNLWGTLGSYRSRRAKTSRPRTATLLRRIDISGLKEG